MRWLVLLVLALAFVLIPFFLLDERIAAALADALAAARGHAFLVGAVIALSLVGDILLPVPSSVVGSFAGAALGFWGGVLAVWLGMSGGCLLGYAVGHGAGHGAMRGVVGDAQVAHARAALAGTGGLALVVTRAVPVLAETLVLGAGAARMPLAPFLALTGSANLAVAVAYSAIGALALSEGSFLLLFGGLAAVPALGWLLWLRLRT